MASETESPPTRTRARGYYDITYTILSICLNGALKTRVMFRSNLNSTQTSHYVDALVKRGMLERVQSEGKAEFWTTSRGRKFLELYSALSEYLEGVPVG